MFAWVRKLFAPAALPTATLYRIQYDVTSTFPELQRTIAAGRRAMYGFKSGSYMSVMRELSQFMEATFGKDSAEQKAVLPSPLVCAKCTTLFPDSWKIRAGLGGGGAPCPGCGGDDALLVLLVYRPEDITDADVAALREYWQSKGEDIDSIQRKLENGLQELKKNPFYFGMQELWLARSHVSQKVADSTAPNDAELKAMFNELAAKATMEIVIMESTTGRQLSERDRFNSIMSRIHDGLNKKLPRPLSNEEFTSLMNRTT